MISGLCVAILLVSCSHQVFGAPSRPFPSNGTSFRDIFSMRISERADDFDEDDHSDVIRMAAIGDSYSAGIGAGDRLGSIGDYSAWICSRYDHSYPWLLHNDPALGDPSTRNFQFRSCSGALVHEVLEKQVPSIDYNQQVILLSAGGNDAGLTQILNSCVYQFLSLTWEQSLIAKLQSYEPDWQWLSDLDWTAVGLSCDEQFDHSQALIDSSDFASNLDSLLSATKAKLGLSGGMIYYTGYAKFFAEDLSDACDNVSWTTWLNKIPAGFRSPEFLTISHRSRMNDLVGAVNAKISAAVQRAGSQVTFVDYDSYVGRFGGRFCESGVDESTYESGSRSGLMFYELNSYDPFGASPWKRSEATSGQGTFQGDLSEFAQIHLSLDPDSQLTFEGPAAKSVADLQSNAATSGPIEIRNPLPDGYGRSFHPQVLLHEIIASKIVYHMTNNKALANAQSGIPETFQWAWCPAPIIVPPGGGSCAKIGDRFDSSTLLRILPLGASIMFGYGSSDLNGFREVLREKLTGNGAPVNYVGSIQTKGSMLDNDVEAVGGMRIDEVAVQAENALPWLPNVVLMHFGNNDAIQDYDFAHAHERLGALIDRILRAVPGVTIMVATLISSTDPVVQARMDVINANIPGMVQSRVNKGKKVQLVNMNGLLTADDHYDSIHPNDAGYAKMAQKFYEGIQQAYSKCWITTPGFVSGLNDTVGTGTKITKCEKIPGNTSGPFQTQKGSGTEDGPYVHKGSYFGKIDVGFPLGMDILPANVRWADINGDGLDDAIYIQDEPNNIATIYVILNDGVHFGKDTTTVRASYIKSPGACKAAGIQFADFDGDGRDDFFCIGLDASLYVWINTKSNVEAVPNFVSAGLAFAPSGYTRTQMRLGDIDGDGRVDYIGISAAGEIVAWRHAALFVSATSWEDMGIMIHAGVIPGDPEGFRFVDINGDGRDDLLWVSDTGTVDTWINLRGQTRSHQPKWLTSGRTHAGGGGITARNQVRFGKLTNFYPEGTTPYPDYQGRGADYTQIPPDNGRISLTINNGNGGVRQKADGSRYCDMRGTGSDDYVWISKTGELQLFGNSHNPPNWEQYDTIYSPPADLMRDHFRKDIHLADMTGDGKCDFVIVNRHHGAVRIVRNDYNAATNKFSWTDSGVWTDNNQNVVCDDTYGIGLFDLGVRFADLDGDGRADYLCIRLDGSTTGWLNTVDSSRPFGVGFTYVGQVKHEEGKNRANIRFYDVTGDGRADYIWLDRVTGAYSYWTNDGFLGPATAPNSAFHWTARGVVGGGGSLRGECINFADLNGDGRADYMDVYPDTNIAQVYYNLCPGSSNPPMIVLPPLP